MLNGFEEKTVGGLAGTETSPGLCLRQQHLSSLIVSSANISLQRTRGFLQLYFLKNLCSVSFFFLFKPSLFVSFFCSSFSLFLHYAPISSPFLRHIHAESLYLSTLCLWRHCTAFLNTFPMVSHRGCCLDVTRTNLPVFSDP